MTDDFGRQEALRRQNQISDKEQCTFTRLQDTHLYSDPSVVCFSSCR